MVMDKSTGVEIENRTGECNGRREGDNVEDIKSSFWLKVIAIIISMMGISSALAVTILFSIYNMTSKINEKAFVLNTSVKLNSKEIKYNKNDIEKNTDRLDVFDTRLTLQERRDMQAQRVK